MLKVLPSELPLDTLGYLAAEQAELNALPSYSEQVKQATASWGRKSRRHFRVIRECLKSAIGAEAVHRCHYCEDSIADEVEHIWPKKFYPERTFSWQNYLFSCGPCNGTAKRDKFAVLVNRERIDLVRGRRAPVLEPPEGISLFIDPRQEDPLDHIELDLESGLFVSRNNVDENRLSSMRANYTVDEVLDLNRDALVRRRKREFKSQLRTLKEYIAAKEADDVVAVAQALSDLQTPLMPTVWQEMIRSRELYPELKTCFDQAQELLKPV